MSDDGKKGHVELYKTNRKNDEIDSCTMHVQINLRRLVDPSQVVFVHQVLEHEVEETEDGDEGSGCAQHDHHGEHDQQLCVFFTESEREYLLGMPSKKTGYFKTLCKIHFSSTHPT